MAKPVGEQIHMVPRGDFRQHKKSMSCWCKPYTRDEEPRVVIHNAMDGREMYDTGKRRPS